MKYRWWGLPLVPLYALGVWLHRRFQVSQRAPLQTLIVGNLSTGGTGKTPHTEYLLRLFGHLNTAFLSRGYRRNTQGFRYILPDSTAGEVGDEPLQIARKFPDVLGAVGENRLTALRQMAREHPHLQRAVLDDAYQHHALRGDVYLLLSTYDQPFFRDFLLPFGNLREPRTAAARAHAIVITKCPVGLSANEAQRYRQAIARFSQAPVFFSSLRYSLPTNLQGQTLPKGSRVLAASGLAWPRPWLEHVQAHYDMVGSFSYGDHHRFSSREVAHWQEQLKHHKAKGLICTEKDGVKIAPIWPETLANQLYVQHVEPEFLFAEEHSFTELMQSLLKPA